MCACICVCVCVTLCICMCVLARATLWEYNKTMVAFVPTALWGKNRPCGCSLRRMEKTKRYMFSHNVAIASLCVCQCQLTVNLTHSFFYEHLMKIFFFFQEKILYQLLHTDYLKTDDYYEKIFSNNEVLFYIWMLILLFILPIVHTGLISAPNSVCEPKLPVFNQAPPVITITHAFQSKGFIVVAFINYCNLWLITNVVKRDQDISSHVIPFPLALITDIELVWIWDYIIYWRFHTVA